MNLNGTWRVKVLSGPLWFRAMNLIRDRKVIDVNTGHNIACGVRWGKFKITLANIGIVLIYDDQPITDILRPGKDGLTGKFYWEGRFVGDFEMVRD